MGRKQIPTHLKLVKGTLRPNRINKQEAQIAHELGMPKAPSFLNAEGLAEWQVQCETLYRVGLLTKIDGVALAAYCQAYGRWQRAEEVLAVVAENNASTKGLVIKTKHGNHIQNPLVGIANRALADCMKYAVELGLTPSSRTRINAEPKQHDDPATKYLS
jgi:P27 family predicted phage terminase small subunit